MTAPKFRVTVGNIKQQGARILLAFPRFLLAILLICVALVAPAQGETPSSGLQPGGSALQPGQASTSATIAPSLSPDQLGAKAALTFTISYAGGAYGVPTPVRQSVLQLPAGLTLNIPSLRSCSAARLEARGPSGCPAQSAIGQGHALVEVHAGTENITEDATLWAFLGPPRNLQPTFEVLAQGYTPIDERMVLNGTVLQGNPPYGEELEMPIPPIPTLHFEPNASISSFSLTIGTNKRHQARHSATVLVPSICPAGGFPFAAEFTYADGSTGDALATLPCAPALSARAPAPLTAHALSARAHAARMISLHETGYLHLSSKHNYTLNEQGSASGTAAGTIYVHLTATSSSRVTAEINIYPHGGSLSGTGTASYHRMGSTASFSGSMSINRGTGSYANARGSGLSLSGTIEESRHDAITVHVNGRVSD